MKRWCIAVLCVLLHANALADEVDEEAIIWLQRMATAAHSLNYSGTFMYHHGQNIETSRITHLVDSTGQYEKLETLDGKPRRIYRTNDEVYCFMPDDVTVMVDRYRVKKAFPALLPDKISEITDHYNVRMGNLVRVAGRESQTIVLEPKDEYRYGHRIYADAKLGLMLKASTWRDPKTMVDQFAFTQITIGGQINREDLKPDLRGKKLVRSTGEGRQTLLPIDAGWSFGELPPGFKRVMELKRVLPGGKIPVNQVVFSDGLAAASVFIEPALDKVATGLSHKGALHVYTRRIGSHQIRVVGEVPSATVIRIGDAIRYQQK